MNSARAEFFIDYALLEGYTQLMKHKRLKIVIGLVVLAVVAGQIAYNYYIYNRVNNTTDSTIVTLITNAVNNLHRPAPVDHRTGDTYFPEARLYVPTEQNGQTLRYNYVNIDGRPELSITSSQVLSRAESKVWNAYGSKPGNAKATLDAVFKEVPHLQTCSRGVQLFQQPQNDNADLKEHFIIKAGSTTWYGYTEDLCADWLEPVVSQLKNLKQYR